MFFGKPAVILYLRRASLEVCTAQGKIQTLDFPQKDIRSLEIVDRVDFETTLTGFFKGLKKQRALILLSPGVLFQKNLAGSQSPIEKAAAQKEFIDAIPLDPGVVAHVAFQLGDNIYCIATNKLLYETVKAVVEKVGWHITGVTPAVVFGISEEASLSSQQIQTILGNIQLATRVNLLNQLSLQTQGTTQTPLQPAHATTIFQLSRKQLVFIVLLIVLIVGSLVMFFMSR